MNTNNCKKIFKRAFLILIMGGITASCGLFDGNDDNLSVEFDTSTPTINSTTPDNGETEAPFNQILTASFNEEMTASTINIQSFTVIGPDALPVTGTVALDGTNKIATFTPATELDLGTVYIATITTVAEDMGGNSLANNYVWIFTTGSTADSTQPTVSLTNPADTISDISINASINATFSEEINPLTLTTDTFVVTDSDANLVTGTVAFDSENNIATFTPDTNLETNTTYTATLTTGIQDLAGLATTTNYVWSFTTGTNLSEDLVFLGSTNNFAIFAGSTVTNTGLTTINGNLGVGSESSVTGFPPGEINGTIYAADSTATQAIADLTDAYDDAAGRLTDPVTVSGNIGGETLTPGLYKSTSSLEITSGDLTLDAEGDANAIFIFQIETTLTTTAGREVILTGGAQSSNIYWQVGTSATFGIYSIFKGNIMADQSITFATGALLDGRALARIGAVTLDTNTVTIPNL